MNISTWHFSVAYGVSLLDFLEGISWMRSSVGHVLFDFWLLTAVFDRAFRRRCITAIFVLFLFLCLHVCYICTTVSRQANSALKVFPPSVFILLKLNHSLGHSCSGYVISIKTTEAKPNHLIVSQY